MAITQAQKDIALWEYAIKHVTPAVIAGGYKLQQDILECTDQNIFFAASRQVGKDVTMSALLFLTSARTPGTECLFLGLVGTQAETHWRTKWRPFLKKYKIPAKHLETGLTTFPNGPDKENPYEGGSTVRFAGMDDAAHIETYLGASMAGGLCVLNELQSVQIDLEDLVERILEPALNQTTVEKPIPGRLALIGSFTDVQAGYYFRLWARGAKPVITDWGEEWQHIDPNADDGYRRFTGARCPWDGKPGNPHLTDSEGALARKLKKAGVTIYDPIVARDYLGKWIFSKDQRTFSGYKESRNQYTPTLAPWATALSLPPGVLIAAVPPAGIDRLAIGIDPGFIADRFAIVAFGWSTTRRIGLIQLAEWVTAKGANPSQTEWVTVVKEIVANYGFPATIRIDPANSEGVRDELYKNHRILIEPAIKGPGSLQQGVARLNDALQENQMRIIAASALEEDLLKSRWSRKAKEDNKTKWDNAHHPDPAMAAIYGIQPTNVLIAPNDSPEDLSNLTPTQREIRAMSKNAHQAQIRDYNEPMNDNNRASAVKRMWHK